MSDLPTPLVGDDVDVTGLDGFMLDVQRLFASELWALSNGDEFKAAVALWGRAWQQKPPGSLPNDERVLAAFSGAGKDWKKVRTMALRGFVECNDGRLYHKVLCDDVVRAHRKRQAFRERTKNATEMRRHLNERRNEQRNDEGDDARNDQRNVVDDADVTSVQGQGQRQDISSLRSDSRPKRVRTRHDYPSDFLQFWAAYPTDPNMGKREALAEWLKLDETERRQAIASCPAFIRHCKADPTYRPIHANRYLVKRRFEGHAEAQTMSREAARTIDFGGGVSWPEATVRGAVARYRADPGSWPIDRIGPPPGAPGCRVPERLLEAA